MIVQLRGKLIEKQPPWLLIDVGGVGYQVQAPLSTFLGLPVLGQEVKLKTHFVVREDAQLLYGFLSKQECDLFQEVIKINGVGPKVALAILSALSPEAFAELIMAEDITRLKAVPGIGLKTAQRILVEMPGKLKNIETAAALPGIGGRRTDAVSALVALGYKPQEAEKAVKNVKNIEQDCELIIKEALQGLASV